MTSLDTCGGSQFLASTTITFDGGTLPTALVASTDFIDAVAQTGARNGHQFLASNAVVQDGHLALTIPGGQSGDNITSAEVVTTFDVLYGSVCTYAILTNVSGSCNGMFFYRSDRQEADIEWISWPNSTSNTASPNGTRAMQYTNQANDGNPDDATMQYGAAPDDATSAVHEYRLDWLPDSTTFYVDGEKQVTLEQNVPSEAGPWTWNNWNDGDPGWTGPPPVSDAVFQIYKIVMYYNLSSDASASSMSSSSMSSSSVSSIATSSVGSGASTSGSSSVAASSTSSGEASTSSPSHSGSSGFKFSAPRSLLFGLALFAAVFAL